MPPKRRRKNIKKTPAPRIGSCVDDAGTGNGDEAETTTERRIRDLSNFGFGVLSSFGLSPISSKSSMSTFDAFSFNSLDQEGKNIFLLKKRSSLLITDRL